MSNVRRYVAMAIIRLGKLISQSAWESEVMESASNASVVATMSYLDKVGFDHCSKCAQTSDLFNVSGRAYCHRHKPNTTATVWAVAQEI